MKDLGSHGTASPSEWVMRWSHLVKAQGSVLDVACGYGRHASWFYAKNHTLALVDRARAAIDYIATIVPLGESSPHFAVVADIENGPWPFEGRRFDAVVVTHYLWRPLVPTLLASLAPGGVLIYETFAQGNETVGKPSRPDFLLRTGELLEICKSLHVVAFEEGFATDAGGTNARFVQRIAAVREALQPLEPYAPARYPLA